MPATNPAASLANVLSLPARNFLVVDAGQQRARILAATTRRGHPRLVRADVIDAHEEGFTTPGELHDEIRRRLGDADPEAVILVLPQHQVLRHVLDAPPGDAAQTRALLEREATSIGGLSDSPWVFDAVRSSPPPAVRTAADPSAPPPPLVAAFCRQEDLQRLIDATLGDALRLFDIRTSGDSLAAAFTASQPHGSAVLVDLGAFHTTVVLVAEGQTIAATTFASGSAAFTEAIAADRGGTREAAEVLKRTEPPDPASTGASHYRTALRAWAAELNETLREWQAEHASWVQGLESYPVHFAGGGSLQPRLTTDLASVESRRFEAWPSTTEPSPISPDLAVAWGALRLGLNLAGPAPSLVPPAHRAHWSRQRLWRGLLSANLTLAAMLAVAIAAATGHQSRLLSAKASWQLEAQSALQQARDIRVVGDEFNEKMEAFRPVLERQRHTTEILQLLATLQAQRTNAGHWYVLLADAPSYLAGSNHFATSAASVTRSPESRPAVLPPTNAPPMSRAFVAEVCFVDAGETMRQALSDLVMDLKHYPLFRNVDVLPAENRRDWVATNLYFPERLFALELNLSEADLLPPIHLPRSAPTNREPRTSFRSGLRQEFPGPNGTTNRASRTR